MSPLKSRLGTAASSGAAPPLCDAWVEDGRRFAGNGDSEGVLGRWPGDLDTDAAVRLAEAVGEQATWATMETIPPVAQKLAERARPQPLDLAILRHLRHLQHVCHRPRLHLRVEEERLPVARARRWPVRAVADLVSHPGDWEHRTLRSIQPARLLARRIEDDWNLYENRVAVRLVDKLLAYLARRLEELRRIEEVLLAGQNHSEEMQRTSFRRAQRISVLWSETLESKTEDELRTTMRRLRLAQRDLQTLLDSPLYGHVPRRAAVSLSLKPTNILVNDPHYRKVAALWRAWVKYGHKRQETHQQRAARREMEGRAWDRFVLHLVVRAFHSLGWQGVRQRGRWTLRRDGWVAVQVKVDAMGVITLSVDDVMLRLLPLCAALAGVSAADLAPILDSWDAEKGELVAVHVGRVLELDDADRASGWSFGGRASFFACSPWGIDSEERMGRLLGSWLARVAGIPYPIHEQLRGLPALPRAWDWVEQRDDHVLALRAPSSTEVAEAKEWTTRVARDLANKAQRAKQARQASPRAPARAVDAFGGVVDAACTAMGLLHLCPVCDGEGIVAPRPGKMDNGADATWWAICGDCSSEWGLRPCTACRTRYRAITPQVGVDVALIARSTAAVDWPDKVLGRDTWAQPCRSDPTRHFRCPHCGSCSSGKCVGCAARESAGG